jgi:putrescine aminotransferase
VLVRGAGATVWDVDGREYVDGTCGLWQCAVGHGREELAEAAAGQMKALEFYASFWQFSNEPSIELATRLVELAPAGLKTVFFTNGGSEGIETAIKLVRLAWHAQGCPERTVILSRRGAYHGVGAASLAATGIPALKEGFGPLAPGFVHLSSPHPSARTEELVGELEEAIEREGSGRIAAFIGEPILGVGGMIPPPDGYWEAVQAVLRRHEIPLILDEIVTAYGRTGHWFAAERYEVDADVLVTAKALTSGYFPMGAVLIGRRLADMLDGVPFRHGFTYNGHPTGSAVALANLAIIERERLLERAREAGAYMLEQLSPLAELPGVAAVRGVGLMLGIELDEPNADRVAEGTLRSGVIVRATGHKIVMSPPLVIDRAAIDRIAETLAKELTAL